mmetsp:Transcript_894/g.2010  ORF Transcript_894/g.2010 Transcript_894/m.2010 type:complete len:250 (-) Transcript_894:103-852(-)
MKRLLFSRTTLITLLLVFLSHDGSILVHPASGTHDLTQSTFVILLIQFELALHRIQFPFGHLSAQQWTFEKRTEHFQGLPNGLLSRTSILRYAVVIQGVFHVGVGIVVAAALGEEGIVRVLHRVGFGAQKKHMFEEVGEALEIWGVVVGAYIYKEGGGCLAQSIVVFFIIVIVIIVVVVFFVIPILSFVGISATTILLPINTIIITIVIVTLIIIIRIVVIPIQFPLTHRHGIAYQNAFQSVGQRDVTV